MTVVSSTAVPYAKGSGVTYRECFCRPFYQKPGNKLTTLITVYSVTARARCAGQKLFRGYKARVTKNY